MNSLHDLQHRHFNYCRWIALGSLVLLTLSAWAKEPLLETKQEAPPMLIQQINAWIAQLDGPQAKPAFANLVRAGELAHPYLWPMLATGSAITKKKVIEILRQTPGKETIPFLLKCLENQQEDPRIRGEVAAALEKFTAPEVIAKLQKYALHRDSRIYSAACNALIQQAASKDTIPYLIALLKHWDKAVAQKAYLKLLEITGRQKTFSDYDSWQQWWTDYQEIFGEEKE